jgi:hypothetical protein
MKDNIWKNVTTRRQTDDEHGEERWLRQVDDKCFVSVLHRMTGFGYMEWETAIRVNKDLPEGRERTWKDNSCDIIRGDWRDELSTMNREELLEWYRDNIDGNRNSMETILKT